MKDKILESMNSEDRVKRLNRMLNISDEKRKFVQSELRKAKDIATRYIESLNKRAIELKEE